MEGLIALFTCMYICRNLVMTILLYLCKFEKEDCILAPNSHPIFFIYLFIYFVGLKIHGKYLNFLGFFVQELLWNKDYSKHL